MWHFYVIWWVGWALAQRMIFLSQGQAQRMIFWGKAQPTSTVF